MKKLYLLPIMMVFIFYSLPSGLVLYWTVTNLIAIGQQMMMKPVVLQATESTPDGPRKASGTKRRKRA